MKSYDEGAPVIEKKGGYHWSSSKNSRPLISLRWERKIPELIKAGCFSHI